MRCRSAPRITRIDKCPKEETEGTEVVLEDTSGCLDTTLNHNQHSGPLLPMLGVETNQILALSILCMELPFDIGFNTGVDRDF